MQQRNKFFVVNIILTVILVIELLIGIGFVNIVKVVMDVTDQNIKDEILDDMLSEDSYEKCVYEYPRIEGVSVEYLGSEYQETFAESGYEFYAIDVEIYNAGTTYVVKEYIELYCEGDEYDDVYNEYFVQEEDDFSYANQEIIPACQISETRIIIQVKKGVDHVTLFLCRDYVTEEYQNMEVFLY